MTTVRPTTTELAHMVSASAWVTTKGSGTRSSTARALASSNASGQTMARVESSGQKARSRWYMPGCTIRNARTRTPSSTANAFSPSSSLRGPKPASSASPNGKTSPASRCPPTPSRPTTERAKPSPANHGAAERTSIRRSGCRMCDITAVGCPATVAAKPRFIA